MPFESRNRSLKIIAINTSSQINKPLTVGVRIQLEQCYAMHHLLDNIDNVVVLGPTNQEQDDEIRSYIPDMNFAKSVNFIKVLGNTIGRDSIIIVKFDEDGTVFGQIRKIFIISNKIFFLISEVYTSHFNRHLHA